MDRTLVAHATLTGLEEQIRSRWADEQWYRANSWANWPDIRKENIAILRSLIRIARAGRHTARNVAPDPIDQAKREDDRWPVYPDGSPVYGQRTRLDTAMLDWRDDSGWREGQPEFNGAFR
jgi:hypothetical protein